MLVLMPLASAQMRPVVSSEKIFSIARGYKFEARDESGVEQFEVNTLRRNFPRMRR